MRRYGTGSERSPEVTSLPNTPVHYEVAGDGPPVVLVHGAMGSGRMWDDQFEAFARAYRTARYDLPGHGRSPLPVGPLSERDVLRSVLDSLEIDRAHVLGLSYGARIAIEFALEYPDRVRSLVLTMGGLPGYEGGGFPEELNRDFERIDAAVKAADLDAAKELTLRLSPMRPAAAIPEVRKRIEAMLDEYSWYGYTTEIEFDDLDPPPGARIRELRVPVLMVGGDREIDAFRQQNRWVAANVRGARLVEIPGAGHVVNMERPDEYNAAVLDFLSEVEARR